MILRDKLGKIKRRIHKVPNKEDYSALALYVIGSSLVFTGIAKDPNPSFGYVSPTKQGEVQRIVEERPLHGREIYVEAERIVREYNEDNNEARLIALGGLLPFTGSLCYMVYLHDKRLRRKRELGDGRENG